MTNNDTGATGRAQQRIEELAEEYIQKWWTKREHKGAARLGFKAGYTAAKAATHDPELVDANTMKEVMRKYFDESIYTPNLSNNKKMAVFEEIWEAATPDSREEGKGELDVLRKRVKELEGYDLDRRVSWIEKCLKMDI